MEGDEVAEVLVLLLSVNELNGLEPDPPTIVAVTANPTESLD